MATYTQTNRRLSLDTPLGSNVLLLASFRGEEWISRPFRFELDMLSTNDAIAATDIVGKSVTWSVQSATADPRYFNGVVSRFAAGAVLAQGLRRYRAEVVPAFWLCTLNRNCLIFQNKSVPQIIDQILKSRGVTNDPSKIKSTHNAWEYCVQYRESDFDFLCRLMEQEGIFYFFQHAQGKHTMVLADQASAYADLTESKLDYYGGGNADNSITTWEHGYEFRAGKWAQTDYNFETPSTSLLTSATTLVKVTGASGYEVFDYPGKYKKTSDGTPLTDTRMEEEETGYEVVHGAGNCKTFSPGGKFTLQKHDSKSEEGKAYVVTSVQHSAADASYMPSNEMAPDYANSFTCIPSTVVFRPRRITSWPVVGGPQTALVVGPSGEEIYCDKYGRIKVQFFWDREGKKDENSSCWLRVAEGGAGKNWGSISLPRVGQEVIVDFLDGNPDRPLVTGRVYNADQMPPYTLPANMTQSGLKTRSSKQGTADNCNELRFEDKKGSEQILFHAEKDFLREVENDDTLTVSHDQTITVKNNRTETVQEGNESVTISKGNRAVTVTKGNDTLDIQQGNRTVTVAQGNDSYQVQKGTRSVVISSNDTLEVQQGNRTVTIDQGNETLEVKQGNRAVLVDMGNDTLTVKQGNQTTSISMGKSSTSAMNGIELTVGSNSIKIDQSGVTISGMAVKISGDTQAQISGAMVSVSGSASVKVSGGSVMVG